MKKDSYIVEAQSIVAKAKTGKFDEKARCEMAVNLAGLLLMEARKRESAEESKIHKKLGRMMQDPLGKMFTSLVADQCFRSHNVSRIANQLSFQLGQLGIPQYLSVIERIQLFLLKNLGPLLPGVFVPLFQKTVRKESSNVIIRGEKKPLQEHMQQRKKESIRINLNRLGEAILGEGEAAKKIELYLKDLENPEVEYISVKISTLFSQIRLVAWKQSLEILQERLKKLYRAAMKHRFRRGNAVPVPKFVNLDMEEYRDLHLTVELFKSVLDEPEFLNYSAGIVLQSYLPDSYPIQQELTEWALTRVNKGGAPIKIRIVKGANLAMEKVEASLHGWPQAPFQTKEEVDANFKRMVSYAMQREHLKAVRIGIGSHNLFDIAYSLLLAVESGLQSHVAFEMLEGMADSMCRVVQEFTGDMLLYCPVARAHEFPNAIAYLVRRLDENTTPENFLRHAFTMEPGSEEWKEQVNRFLSACSRMKTVGTQPRRTQNRLSEKLKTLEQPFENEPDTDWSLKENRHWVEAVLRKENATNIGRIPCVVAGERLETARFGTGRDPSRPEKSLYTFSLAEGYAIEKALNCAEESQKTWGRVSIEERSRLLANLANLLRSGRGDLIGAMVADTGKTVTEADSEISEAIDFVDYYRKKIEELSTFKDLSFEALGTVLVAPPWNFPCSIPMGGIAAALATGNCVIFKPAPEAIYVGWVLVNFCWQAGFTQQVLQYLVCEDEPEGSKLIRDSRIDVVLLTGATETAKKMMKMRPGLHLLAETGGKNALIITAMADRDLAAKDLVHSAFGHSGQKCSACSLAICEEEVYNDPQFRKAVKDAAESLKIGSAWDLSTRVNPLIREPSPALKRALTTLEEGEEWLLEPKQDPENPNLWSPGIKMGVQRGGVTHQTELFGPVLGVMCAQTLDEAIEMANETRYGLTAGIHTLDEREQSYWEERIQAGNCYINRGITGAIVQRQPFGGCKDSAFGNGWKAGGPNYLIPLLNIKQVDFPKEKDDLPELFYAMHADLQEKGASRENLEIFDRSLQSYIYHWNHYFSQKHDPSQLLGQDNFLKYVPKEQILFRINASELLVDQMRIIAAAEICGTPLEVSGESEVIDKIKGKWIKNAKQVHFISEDASQLLQRVKTEFRRNARSISPFREEIRDFLSEKGCTLLAKPPLANGRIELLSFLREVSLSIDYHRYGNPGLREHEIRAPIL